MGEPFGVFYNNVKLVTVNDEEFLARRAFKYVGFFYFNSAKMRAEIVSHHLIMVARDVDNFAAFSRFSQNFLNHIIMALRPIPAFP